MNAYPSQPSQPKTATTQARNQSPAPSLQQYSSPTPYELGSPQANTYTQPNYNHISVNTSDSILIRSSIGNGYPTDAQSLIGKMDSILKQNQSPAVSYSSPERKDFPGFNQPSFQNQGIYTSPAYSYPLNSARSQNVENTSPLGLRQSIANDNRSVSGKSDKNQFPVQESLKASHLSSPQQGYPQTNSYGNSNTDDLKSRLSNLENQLNAITSRQDYKEMYPPQTSLSVNNSAYYPTTTQQQSSYEQENYSQYPTRQTIQRQPTFGESDSQYPLNGYVTPVETNPRRDAEVSGQIVKKIDDLMNAHIFENRSPIRSAALSQRNHYASPSRDTFSSPMYKSSISSTAKPTRDFTPPNHKESYTARPGYDSYSNYEPYSSYEPRPNYHSNTNYEPISKYGSDQTNYEPTSKYDTYSSKSYEPHHSYTSSYEPRYDYERDTTSKPYSDNYSSYKPYTSDYDAAPVRRQKYVRPLYRNTPEKYRPASTYTADYYPQSYDQYPYHASMHSSPSREYPDTTATDKKLKKLTLKSKPSEDKDNEQPKLAPLPIKNPLHHHGTKRPKFKGGDLMSDDETDVIPLPQMEETNKSRKVNSSLPSKNDKGQKFHAGDLQGDDSTIQYHSDEEPVNVIEHKKVNAKVPDQYANGYRIRTADDFNAGNLQSDTNHNAGDLVDDEEPVQKPNVSHRKGAGASNTPQKSDQRVYRHHAGALLSDGVPVKTRNIVDDGKAWNLPHVVSNSIFEETDSSMFDFEGNDQKPSRRASNQKNSREVLEQSQMKKSKGVIWSVEDPTYDNRQRIDSMRRSDRKPVISESFERYGRVGY